MTLLSVSMFVLSVSFVTSYRHLPKLISKSYVKKLSTGHQAPAGASVPNLSATDEQALTKFYEKQAGLKRMTYAEEVRTLLDQSIGFGVLSTNSKHHPGFPSGSVVGFQLDDKGFPFFSLSTISSHTIDLLQDGRSSLTVLAKDFKGAAQGRVSLAGTIVKVTDEEKRAQLNEMYRARHKDAYWVEFGDFAFFKMESIEAIRFVGGFAMAGNVSPEDYKSARPDPLAPFAHFIIDHMNKDHADATADIVRHYAGVPCREAAILSLDRFGMMVSAKIQLPGETDFASHKVRVSFCREISTRKEAKEVIIEMTNAAGSSKS